jgi:hypothetical protein
MPPTAPSLFELANLLHLRWDRFKQPDDIKYCVNYLRHLRDQRPLLVDMSHDDITSELVWALGEQVKSQSRSDDVMENIKEMAVLCLEMLNSDDAFIPLFEATVDPRRESICIDQVIECFRQANIRFPYSPRLSHFLGELLSKRFFEKGFADDDYNEAIASLNRAITLATDLFKDTDDYDQNGVQNCLWSIATTSYSRYDLFGKPEYLEEAISHHRTYLSSSCVRLDHPRRLDISRKLAELVDSRIRYTHSAAPSHQDPFDLSTISTLSVSISEINSWTDDQWIRHFRALSSVHVAIHSGSEIVENEEVFRYCRQLVDFTTPWSNFESSTHVITPLYHVGRYSPPRV